MQAIAGRTALVTGATGGLGQAIARRLCAEGAQLIITGRRGDVLDRLADELGARALVCDLAERRDVERLSDATAAVDILVSNAALPATGPIDEFTVEQVDRALDVNLRAPLLLAREASAAMARRGSGHIVFVSSMAAKTSGPAISIYSATKLGLRGLALSLRWDLRPQGVGVSVVYPGPIRDAGMWADAGIETPWGMPTKSPEAVAAAVVDAITSNRAEVDVAPFLLRAMAVVAQLRPSLFAALGRRSGQDYAEAMAAAGREKR